MKSVANGLSIRESSTKCHVPYTTLNSHVNNQVVCHYPGCPTKFTEEEEICLEQSALVLQVREVFSLSLFSSNLSL